MDARKTLGAGLHRLVSRETHSESETLPAPLTVEQVYHDYAPRVFSVARSMVGSDFDAEDVTQDVLLQVVRKLPTFRGDSAFPTWLHRVTVNAALSHRRRQAVRQEHGLDRSLDVAPEGESTHASGRAELPPDDLLLSREAKAVIDRAIAGLPEMYREVFVLADVEGLPNAEVGVRLGMTLPAVKSRLHRARAMLREALTPHFDEVGV
jgi:RNA polymerase sigma-70 factor, ECF subfamily